MNFPQWTRKAKILSSSFLAAAFLVTLGFAVQGRHQARAYQLQLNNSYQHAFAELTTAVAEMDAALQKASYATSPALVSSLCTELFGKAMSAQMAIGELPYGNVELEQTAAFVAKAGDYAAALSRSAAQNGGCSEDERAALRGLAEVSSTLSQLLADLEADIHTGSMTLEDLSAAQRRLSAATEDGAQALGGSAFQTIESDFPEIPTLIYDGPFSAHLSNRSPQMLAGLDDVPQETARSAAAAFLGLKPSVFTAVSRGEGALPTWGLSAQVDGGELYAEVTRQGGQVVAVTNSRPVGAATVSSTEAVRLASDFLSQHGYPDMVPSYFISQGNILTINFAAQQDGVLCYPDLVKVSIALDNGSLVSFEAHGYLMNHTHRTLGQPDVSLAQAQMAVSPDLDVLSHQMALIPTHGENEVLCYEFKCAREDGRHVIVYVNAQTGGEEKILLLLEDESGTLAL